MARGATAVYPFFPAIKSFLFDCTGGFTDKTNTNEPKKKNNNKKKYGSKWEQSDEQVAPRVSKVRNKILVDLNKV